MPRGKPTANQLLTSQALFGSPTPDYGLERKTFRSSLRSTSSVIDDGCTGAVLTGLVWLLEFPLQVVYASKSPSLS